MQRRIRREFSSEKPTLWVGKNGVTPDLLDEAHRQLESREIVKIRLHRTVPQSTEKLAHVLAAKTSAEIADIRGRSFVIYLHPKKKWKTNKEAGEEDS